jgi:hypothetical protein
VTKDRSLKRLLIRPISLARPAGLMECQHWKDGLVMGFKGVVWLCCCTEEEGRSDTVTRQAAPLTAVLAWRCSFTRWWPVDHPISPYAATKKAATFERPLHTQVDCGRKNYIFHRSIVVSYHSLVPALSGLPALSSQPYRSELQQDTFHSKGRS